MDKKNKDKDEKFIEYWELSMDAFLSFAMSYLFSFLFYYIPVWNINSFKYNVVLNKKKKKSKKK